MTIALDNKAGFLLGLTAGAGSLWWLRRNARTRPVAEAPAAAFAGPGAAEGAFVHTRDAGPDHIRDETGEDWDRVDETSDESFPASDPPSSY